MDHRRTLLRAAALAALTLAAAPAAPAAAQSPATWLCRPGQAGNPCTPGLTTTTFRGWASGAGSVATPRRVREPRVDCFYVYPTVSNQETRLANRRIDPELRSIALYQVSRYSQHCRVFAPVYRQATVPALQSGRTTAADYRTAYGDVSAAFTEFLRRHSRGRPFVLIGHSQGTYHLQRLVRQRIDGNRSLRRRMVSALLLGGNVTVRKGSTRGGSFRTIPACRRKTQINCVIAFSAFNDVPPSGALFGRGAARVAEFLGLPSGPNLEALCTNPAALGTGRKVPLDTIAPTQPFAPGTLIAAGITVLGLEYPRASTTYVRTVGAFTGRCSKAGGASFLRVDSAPGTPVPRASPTAEWGLHLVDANIALGDLVDVVRRQIAAYARRR